VDWKRLTSDFHRIFAWLECLKFWLLISRKGVVDTMTDQIGREAGLIRNPLLSAAGLVAAQIVFGLVNATQSHAQQQVENTATLTPAFEFEVASIRPLKPDSFSGMVRIMFEPDGFSATNVTLQRLITGTYDVDFNQVSGAPKWINSERYDIEAKIDSATADAIGKLGEDQRQLVQEHMVQALLAGRFKLAFHRETKELPIYSLVIAKNGPKFHEAKPGETPHMRTDFLEGRITGQAVPLNSLVKRLSMELGRRVVDKTGLTGNYDFTIQCAPGEIRALADGGGWIDNTPPTESAGTSVLTAPQEQLGLKLESQKGPIEFLVIDHIEKPSEN
jgi:uncharacterized protein (TIGR03435 family)